MNTARRARLVVAAPVAVLAVTLALTLGVRGASAITLAENPFLEQAGPVVSGEITTLADEGYSVAVSEDGNTAIVGAPEFNGFEGAAFVFVRSGTTWTQQGKALVGKGASKFAQEGKAVALSGDGNTAFIGGPQNEGPHEEFFGTTWVFTRSGTTWTEQQQLIGKGTGSTEKAGQGAALALSKDGKTALIGAELNSSGIGGAFVFTLGAKWEQQGTILVGKHGTEIPLEGESVALSAEGNTALIGGPKDETAAKHPEEGSVWVFTRSGGVWSEQAELGPGSSAGEKAFQGKSVALSGDGNTALVGGSGYNSLNGAAWVYTRSGTTWSQQAGPLLGEKPILGPEFGFSSALSESGNTALIGGEADNGEAGATWAFERSGTAWTEQKKIVGEHPKVPSEQGWSVALSADGSTGIIGAPANNSGLGAFWVFARAPEKEKEKEPEKPKEKEEPPPQQQKETPQNTNNGASAGASVAAPSNGSTDAISSSQPSAAQIEAALASAFGLPSAKACYSHRSFKIRIRQPHGYPRIISAEVFLGKKRERSLDKKGLVDQIVLTGLPYGTFTIRIVARTTTGTTLTGTRTYHTCRAKPLKAHHHKP